MISLTKIEKEILLDRLGLPDCIYDAMYRDMDPQYPYGKLNQEQVYEVCRMAESIVESGNIPDFGALSIPVREIILESFEGGTYFRRMKESGREVKNKKEAENIFQKSKTAFLNLQKKLSEWSGQKVTFQE